MKKSQVEEKGASPNFSMHLWDGWGDVIRLVREQADLDQEVFGRLMGDFNKQQISRYERQQSQPPLDFWRAFAATFRLNLNYVLMGLGEPLALSDFDPKANENRRKTIEKRIKAADRAFDRQQRKLQEGWDKRFGGGIPSLEENEKRRQAAIERDRRKGGKG